MPKLPECDRCLFCAHDHYIICAIHPSGIDGDNCLDFRPDHKLEGKYFRDFLGLGAQQQRDLEVYSNLFELEPDEELWKLESACYYNNELVL